MKYLCFAMALALLLGSNARAAEAPVAGDTLANMGLGSMPKLSDAEGLQVRGKGTFASVSGTSTARWGGQISTNSYSASSSWLGKPAGALGSSFSFAGKIQFSKF
jgi:hypothetical protein